MSRVAAYVPDLMDRSRLAGLGPDVDVTFAARPADLVALAEGVDVVVVDLARPGVLDVLPALSGRVIGFGSHVDRATLDAARAAGCEEVLPRSAFFGRLAQHLAP